MGSIRRSLIVLAGLVFLASTPAWANHRHSRPRHRSSHSVSLHYDSGHHRHSAPRIVVGVGHHGLQIGLHFGRHRHYVSSGRYRYHSHSYRSSRHSHRGTYRSSHRQDGRRHTVRRDHHDSRGYRRDNDHSRYGRGH